jgi:hypothetical protein
MKDAAPKDFEAATARLDDYVRGALGDEHADGFEDELFERALAGSAPELAFRHGLGATLNAMDARGTLDPWITAHDLERVRASGLNIVYFEVDLENPSMPEIPQGTDLLIGRIPLDLTGVRELEVEALASDGRVLKSMPDVKFDRSDNAIYACCEADLALIAARADRTTRFWAVDESGRKLLLELPGG